MPTDEHLPGRTTANLAAIHAFQRAVDHRVHQRFLRVGLRHRQVQLFGHRRAHATAFDGEKGGVFGAALALGVAVVTLANCNLIWRYIQSGQYLRGLKRMRRLVLTQ